LEERVFDGVKGEEGEGGGGADKGIRGEGEGGFQEAAR